MKNFVKSLVFLLIIGVTAISCKNVSIKQTVSGKAGEVIVVIDPTYWENQVGNELRTILAAPYPSLPQVEASFNILNVAPRNFNSVLQIHRNIIIVKIEPELPAKISLLKDVWAAPQIVFQITAPNSEKATELIKQKAKLIFSSISNIEKERIINNAKRYEERETREAVEKKFGGSPYFPKGYYLKKETKDFMWISYEPTYTIQSILIYKIPYVDSTSLQLNNLLAAMGKVMENNVPGMVDNSYMIFNNEFEATYEKVEYAGNEFIEIRGLWEVQNDFMGGPFVAHAYYNKNNPSEILILEGFVYAAKFDKLSYVRQIEAILYSFDYKDKLLN